MEGEQTRHEETEPQSRHDAAQVQYALDQFRSEQNLSLGIAAGAVAALVGAAVWAVVTVVTGYQIGWLAVGVGFLVGIAIRHVGKGIDPVFGIAGAILALLGCLLGNLLAVCGFIASQESIPFFEVLAQLDSSIVVELMAATFSPMDLLFYGIAVYEGYKLSLRRITQTELEQRISGSTAT